MRVFYDTEFIENGRTIDLISIAMVAEDGRELYLVDESIEEEELYKRITSHNWLMENVIPHLPLATKYDGMPHLYQPGHPNVSPRKTGTFSLDAKDNRVVSRRFIRNAVRDFLAATPDVELWAWFAAYDHVVLAQLFGPMIDLPANVPMWTNDLQQEIERLQPDLAELPTEHGNVHDALADAEHARAVYDHLAALDVS